MPPTKHDIVARFSENDPAVFLRMLKKHVREVQHLMETLESSKDPRVTQSCISLFYRMFQDLQEYGRPKPRESDDGGESEAGEDDSETWQESPQRGTPLRAGPASARKLRRTPKKKIVLERDTVNAKVSEGNVDVGFPSGEDDEDDITLDPVMDPLFLVDAGKPFMDIAISEDGVPPPPPPLPPQMGVKSTYALRCCYPSSSCASRHRSL
jgi:hypothetical protein